MPSRQAAYLPALSHLSFPHYFRVVPKTCFSGLLAKAARGLLSQVYSLGSSALALLLLLLFVSAYAQMTNDA